MVANLGNRRITLHGPSDSITADIMCCSCAQACSSCSEAATHMQQRRRHRCKGGGNGGCWCCSHEAQWQEPRDAQQISEGVAQQRPRCEDDGRCSCSSWCVGFGGQMCLTPNNADNHQWHRVVASDGRARRAQCGFWCMEKTTASLRAHRCVLRSQRSMLGLHGATGQGIGRSQHVPPVLWLRWVLGSQRSMPGCHGVQRSTGCCSAAQRGQQSAQTG